MDAKNTKKKTYEINMINGSLFDKILLFSLPLIASNILQLLFNAADVVVVGRFAGSESLAAVGSTSSLTNLIVNLFIGFSLGSNVVLARYYGAGKEKEISDTVHTSITISLVAGVMLTIIGFIASRPMLSLMGTPSDVIDYSVIYMRYYFAGMPVMMLYNFGSAILRTVGDTRRPLYYLTLAGIVNVVLNLFFVIVFGMGVRGVALATVISQAISAFLVIRSIVRAESAIKLDFKKLRISTPILKQIAAIGFPAGIQGAVFSISNILIQSSVNSFGSIVMAGNTAAMNIESFVYSSMNSVSQATVSFVGQNAGALKFDRVKKSVFESFILVTIVGLLLGLGIWKTDAFFLGFFSESDDVIKSGMVRLGVILPGYFLCGTMEVFVGGLRGLGQSFGPTVVSLLGACALRIIYIFTIFQIYHTPTVLFLSYPISWLITGSAQLIFLIIVYKKTRSRLEKI